MARKGKRERGGFPFFQVVFLLVFLGLIGALLYRGGLDFFKKSDIFKVREITFDPALKIIRSPILENLKGANIFRVNIKVVQRRLQAQYPEIDQLQIIRHFPDKLHVVAHRRQPFFAVAVKGKTILLDREGLVLSPVVRPRSAVPVVHGVKIMRKLVVGRGLDSREADVALELIKAVQTNEDLRSLAIVSLDVGNLSKIHFRLTNNLNIIMDDSTIYPKVRKLGILLSQKNINWKDYKYVDMRFQEPVLGKNEP